MESTAASEERLIRGLQTGDHRAFRKVYDAYHPAIFNLCARIVGDREEAKDLTQEAFLRAFSAPPEPRAELGLRPWLYRVATNLCLNHLRTAHKAGAVGDGEVEQLASPVDGFQQAQTVALVEETLGRLNNRYRTALVLKDLHGLPSEELASVMETSRASADVLVHRARASFKSVFSRLAGEGAPVPGNLALVLAPLAVPAALQVVPPVPHVPVPMPANPAHPFDGSSAGLLGKLSAALGSKVAVAAATAGLIAGGLATEQVVTRTMHRPPPKPAVAEAVAVSDQVTSPQAATTASQSRYRVARWAGHGCPAGDASCTSGHVGSDGHYGATYEAGHVPDRTGDASGHGTTTGQASPGSHDSGAGTTTHDGGTSGTSAGHDGGTGTTSGGHDSGAGTSAGHGATGDRSSFSAEVGTGGITTGAHD